MWMDVVQSIRRLVTEPHITYRGHSPGSKSSSVCSGGGGFCKGGRTIHSPTPWCAQATSSGTAEKGRGTFRRVPSEIPKVKQHKAQVGARRGSPPIATASRLHQGPKATGLPVHSQIWDPQYSDRTSSLPCLSSSPAPAAPRPQSRIEERISPWCPQNRGAGAVSACDQVLSPAPAGAQAQVWSPQSTGKDPSVGSSLQSCQALHPLLEESLFTPTGWSPTGAMSTSGHQGSAQDPAHLVGQSSSLSLCKKIIFRSLDCRVQGESI